MSILNDDGEVEPVTNRHVGRVRELAVQAIVEGTARAELARTIGTRSLQTGEDLQLSVGDNVEFYREPSSKDGSGWHTESPAKVTDVSQIHRGIIKIRYKGEEMSCTVNDVRPFVDYFVFLLADMDYAYFTNNAVSNAWKVVSQHFECCQTGMSMLFGPATQGSRSNPRLSEAAMFFLSEGLYRQGVKYVRIGKGMSTVPSIKAPSCHASLLITWAGIGHQRYYQESQLSDKCRTAVNFRVLYPDSWKSIRFIQSMESHEVLGIAQETVDQDATAPNGEVTPDVLSDIPEEDEDMRSSNASLSPFVHDDPCLKSLLTELSQVEKFDEPLESVAPRGEADSEVHIEPSVFHSSESFSCTPDIQSADGYYHVVAANIRAGIPPMTALEPFDPDTVEVYFEDETWKLLSDVERAPCQDECVILLINKNTNVKRAVIKRQDDTLTKEEIEKHRKEVDSAMKEELLTWMKHKCFSRKQRRHARNIIDSRWVLKWKFEYAAIDLADSQTGQVGRWVIRARLTVRGFKDIEKTSKRS